MKDFNNIETETDPIPEGLEFNESYMQNAFAMYDAEKNKRKRRLLIWWITSALGFTSVLLIGMGISMRDEPAADSGKNRVSDTEKDAFMQQSDVPHSTAGTVSAHRSNKTDPERAATTTYTPAENSGMIAKHHAAVKTSGTSKNGIITRPKSTSSLNLQKGEKNGSGKIPGVTPGSDHVVEQTGGDGIPTRSTIDPAIPEESSESAQTPSDQSSEPVDLPLKPAMLAYTSDSALLLPAIEQSSLLPAEETDTRKHHVYLNLGVNTLFGIQELKKRATFRESIGLSYTYQLNSRMAIHAGLEYHSISRITYQRMIGDTLNSDKTTTILNKTTLNYVSFLPQFHYQLWPHHRITAGFGIEYLLTDPGEQYEIKNYTQESQKRTNSKLYYSTFNRFNFSLSLGYVYEFGRYMSVQASYHYGFTDITINNNFNKTFDRNSRLQLGLKIKLY